MTLAAACTFLPALRCVQRVWLNVLVSLAFFQVSMCRHQAAFHLTVQMGLAISSVLRKKNEQEAGGSRIGRFCN